MNWSDKIENQRKSDSGIAFKNTINDLAFLSGFSVFAKIFSTCVSHPFDLIRQHAQSSPYHYRGMVHSFTNIGGIQNLYRGYSLTIFHTGLKQFVYRTPLMSIASIYELNSIESAILMTSGEFVFGLPINRVKTNHITGTGNLKNNFYSLLDNSGSILKRSYKSIQNFCRGAAIKAPLDFIGWGIFFNFDKFIKDLSNQNGQHNYSVVITGYCVAGSVCEFALSPLKVALTQVQRNHNPLDNQNLVRVISHIHKTQGLKALYAGFIPSSLSAVSKLVATSLIQDMVSKSHSK